MPRPIKRVRVRDQASRDIATRANQTECFPYLSATVALPLNSRSNLIVCISLQGLTSRYEALGLLFEAGLIERGIQCLQSPRPPTADEEGRHYLHAFYDLNSATAEAYRGYTGVSWDQLAARVFDGEREAWAVQQGSFNSAPVQGFPLDCETLKLVLGFNAEFHHHYISFSANHVRPTVGSISLPHDFMAPPPRKSARRSNQQDTDIIDQLPSPLTAYMMANFNRLAPHLTYVPSLAMRSVSSWTPSQLAAVNGGPGNGGNQGASGSNAPAVAPQDQAAGAAVDKGNLPAPRAIKGLRKKVKKEAPEQGSAATKGKGKAKDKAP